MDSVAEDLTDQHGPGTTSLVGRSNALHAVSSTFWFVVRPLLQHREYVNDNLVESHPWHVRKLSIDLELGGGFSRVLRFPPPGTTDYSRPQYDRKSDEKTNFQISTVTWIRLSTVLLASLNMAEAKVTKRNAIN